jgi:hypothetical protein
MEFKKKIRVLVVDDSLLSWNQRITPLITLP